MSPLVIGIIIIVVGLLLGIGGLVARSRGGRIAAAPLARTGEAVRATGLVGVEGEVRTDAPLAAPCTGTPCVAFRLKLEKKVKEKRGGQTSTSWKLLAEQHQGSLFALDDGSGPVGVQAQEVDGDLEQTFAGAPPQAVLAQYAAAARDPREEILEYRAIEKLVRVGARVYALGAVGGGRLAKPADGKLLISTRGRDALVGRAKRIALGLFVAGGLATAGGATVAILRPGEVAKCGQLADQQLKACRVAGDVREYEDVKPDGSKTKEKRHEATVTWKVTKSAKFEIEASQPKKQDSNPYIQVVDAVGLPRNIDFGIALGAGRYTTKTKTMTLEPGEYQIHVFSLAGGPSEHVLTVTELPGQ